MKIQKQFDQTRKRKLGFSPDEGPGIVRGTGMEKCHKCARPLVELRSLAHE